MTLDFDPIVSLERLDTASNRLISRLRELATRLDFPLYLVGGIVRDFWLDVSSIDLDFVIEGRTIGEVSGIVFAEAVLQAFGGELHRYPRFGTANWRPAEPPYLDIDFVTARSEIYARPGALPTVTPSTLSDDLARRDFTINTLALRLDGDYYGRLIDPFNGMADLEAGLVQVLHQRSFVDDPTRLFRAMRYASRTQFRLSDETRPLFEQGLAWVDLLSGERVAHELLLLLNEADPAEQMLGIAKVGLLQAINIDWVWQPKVVRWWERLAEWPEPLEVDGPTGRLLLMIESQNEPEIQERLLDRLNIAGGLKELSKAITAVRLAMKLAGQRPPSVVYRAILAEIHRTQLEEAIPFAWAAAEEGPGRDWLESYWHDWRHIRPQTTGQSLIARGLRPGPQFKSIIDRVVDGYIDGTVTAETEKAWVDHLL